MTIKNRVDGAIGLGYSNYWVPDLRIDVESYFCEVQSSFPKQIINYKEFSKAFKQKNGAECIYSGNRGSEPHILYGLVDQYFDDTRTDPSEIDLLIYARGNSIVGNIDIPYHIQNKYKFDNALIFNIEQNCSGTAVALQIISSLMKTNGYRRAIIMTSSFIEKLEERFWGAFVVSDGVGIMEVVSGPVSDTVLDQQGTSVGARDLASILPTTPKARVAYIRNGTSLVQKLFRKNNITPDDVELLLPPNSSIEALQLFAELLGFPYDKIFTKNIPDGGHFGDLDFIKNVTDVRRSRLVQQGGLYMIYGLGAGTSWNACLVRS